MKTKARFVLSKKKAIEGYNEISQLADIVSYSFKTNREVGFILKDDTDCNFSIHSPKALALLKCPERVWYFAQGWDNEELKSIYDAGVRGFVVDNTNDLDLLLEFLKTTNEKISLLLRMRLKEKTIHTGKHFVFGFYSSQVREMVPELKENPYIESLGIHFHRKTQNISEWSLKYEIENVLDNSVLEKLDYVNIGGGVPVKYKNFSADVIENIFDKINEFRDWLKQFGIKTIIEPGRFIAAPAVKLEAHVMSVLYKTIIIGCSVYNGAMDTFVTNIRLEVENELSQDEGEAYTIKGKTPDSIDIFRYRVYLNDPKPGDTITFLNAGAYTYSTDFCLLEPLETVICD